MTAETEIQALARLALAAGATFDVSWEDGETRVNVYPRAAEDRAADMDAERAAMAKAAENTAERLARFGERFTWPAASRMRAATADDRQARPLPPNHLGAPNAANPGETPMPADMIERIARAEAEGTRPPHTGRTPAPIGDFQRGSVRIPAARGGISHRLATPHDPHDYAGLNATDAGHEAARLIEAAAECGLWRSLPERLRALRDIVAREHPLAPLYPVGLYSFGHMDHEAASRTAMGALRDARATGQWWPLPEMLAALRERLVVGT